MSRVLSMLLVLSGLVLVAPPAQAALSVTISVSRTTLSYGSTVVFSGRAAGAKPGSVVKLRRKTADGWRTVASKKVGSTRSYRFRVTPPRGYQYYRVLKPRQLGQASAVSRTVKLTVRWRPVVALGDVSHEVDVTDGTVTTTTDGNTRWLPAGTRLRRDLQQPDGTWAEHGSVSVAADHTWSDTFASSHNWRLRYTAPVSGPRLATSSASFAVDGSWTPTIAVEPTMDPLTDEATVSGTTTGLTEGSTVQREYGSADSWVAEGTPVPVGADGTFTDAFRLTMNRSYRYIADAAEPRQEASSAPFEFTDAPAGRVSLNTTTAVVLPAGGTERTLLLHLDEGQTFTYHGPSWVTESVTDPSGAAVPGFGPADETVTAVAPLEGDYTIRLAAGSASSRPRTAAVTLSAPVVIPTTLDADSQDVASTLPGQVVDLVFAADGGSVVSEYATPDPRLGSPQGTVSLLDPSGAVVPRWGWLVREGKNWRLPAASGDYTLRITPRGGDLVDRQDQSVLAGHEATSTVDGAPGHVSLDRPGRVGVVTVTVPAGLDLRLSDTGPVHLSEELFAPDGRRIQTYETSPDVDPTEAGTYTQLVSYDDAAEVEYYASTPATYDAAVGSAVAFDQGAAPDRQAMVRIPVTEGQLFSFEVLDDTGAYCRASPGVESGGELLEWLTRSDQHPSVVKVAHTGELVVGVTPCTATGTFRLQPTTVVPSTVTGTSTTSDGYTRTTSTATLEATVPGQVMLMEYDAGFSRNQLRVSATGSSFPDGTQFSLAYAEPGMSSSTGFSNGTVDTLPVTLYGVTGPTYFFLYAGPTATGTLDLELSRLDY